MAAREKSDAMLEAQEEFTAEQWAAVDAIIGKNKAKPGSLIPVLEEIQESIGYLPKSIQDRVAHGLRIPSGEVYGVVTFYSFFTMVPGESIASGAVSARLAMFGGAERTLKKSWKPWGSSLVKPPGTESFLWKRFAVWVRAHWPQL